MLALLSSRSFALKRSQSPQRTLHSMPCLFPFSSKSKSSTLSTFSDDKPRQQRRDQCDFPRRSAQPESEEGRAAKEEREVALLKLKTEMEERKVDVYVVPSEDEHLSEYVSEADQRRAFITGFNGSAGTAVITKTENLLYVDSRYWIQAPQQVSSSWKVKRVGDKDQKDWSEDLIKTSETEFLRIGIDPSLISAASGGVHTASVGPLLDAPNLNVVPISQNLVDLVWTSRPSRSTNLIDLHPIEFSGLAASSKLSAFVESETFKALSSSKRPEGYFLSTLDELAWLLNLRSVGDNPQTPVFHAYMWIPLSASFSTSSLFSTKILFINPVKISSEVSRYLDGLGITVRPYDDVWEFLQQVGKSLQVSTEEKESTKRVVLTGQFVTWKSQLAVGKDYLESVMSPILESKAVKNAVELEGMRKAYLRDGRATVRWMSRIDTLISKESKQIDEFEAGDLLTKYRSQEKYFRGLAYDNISGSGPNGALPHYSPVEGNCRIVDRETPYVNDSGAQYLDGTIDTTRTMHFGTPTKEQKGCFTHVLQGHIAVETAVFPKGMSGAPLNILARQHLWKAGLDFGHGVGHGIGSYLSVHEGPQAISATSTYPLRPGHVISNEPGYYKEGHFGIRIESALEVVEVKTEGTYGDVTWYGFKRITRVPIDRRLVDASLLSPDEKKWIRDHNELCRTDILPLLKGKENQEAREWLKKC